MFARFGLVEREYLECLVFDLEDVSLFELATGLAAVSAVTITRNMPRLRSDLGLGLPDANARMTVQI